MGGVTSIVNTISQLLLGESMKKSKITKQSALLVMACLYVGCLIAANTAAGKTFDIMGWSWTTAFVVFPIIYIINDILAEVYGYKKARLVIFIGFAVNFLAVIAYQVMLAIPGSAFFTEQSAFQTVLGTTVRATCASFAGYLAGSTLNAKIMQIMHDKHGEKHLMARCVTSTLFGEVTDAAVFNIGMFAFILPWEVIFTTIITYGLAKVLYEIVVYPVTRKCILWAKGLQEQ